VIHFDCMHCQATLQAPDGWAGRRVRCTQCGKGTRIPLVEPPREAAELATGPVEGAARPAGRPSSSGLPYPAAWMHALLDALRGGLGGARLESLCGVAGHVFLYGILALAVVMFLALFGAVSLDGPGKFSLLRTLFVMLVLLIACQYIIGRLYQAGRRLIESTPHAMASTALPDCFAAGALAALVAAVPITIAEIWGGGSWQEWIVQIVSALAVMGACFVGALVAINPPMLNLEVEPNVDAPREAMGVISFLFKFGIVVGPVIGAALVVSVFVQSLFDLWHLFDKSSGGRSARGLVEAGSMVGVFTLYYGGVYLLFLLYHLLLAFYQATFRISANTDRLPEG